MADSIVSEGRIARSVSAGHSGGGVALPSQFGSRIASFQGQGSSITGDLKTRMESGFGRDFSNVRLHTDDAAAEMSSSISAKAFTYGNDIFFNRGHFSPETNEGQHLIAHELTHVVQGNRKVSRKGLTQEQLYSTIVKYYLLEGDNIKEADCDRFTNLALQLDKDHMNALLKDHYSSIEYLMDHSSENYIRLNLKFNPDKFSYLREQYSYLSPNEVLLLNMLTYLPYINPNKRYDSENENQYIRQYLVDSQGKTVGSLISTLKPLLNSKEWVEEEDETITKSDWRKVFSAIENNRKLKGLIIQRTSKGNKNKGFTVLFLNNKSKEAIVAFRGTGKQEWKDNIEGATSSSTKEQENALDTYYDFIGDDYDRYYITVTGHSKGGNKAKYVALKSTDLYVPDRAISYDGQGFSDEFKQDNQDRINSRQNRIVNYNNARDFVNPFLNDVGETHYLDAQNYDVFSTSEEHSPEVMLNFYDEKGVKIGIMQDPNKDEDTFFFIFKFKDEEKSDEEKSVEVKSTKLAAETERDPLMVELDRFVNRYLRSLRSYNIDLSEDSIELVGTLVQELMQRSDTSILSKLNLIEYYIRKSEKNKNSVAFLLAFIVKYINENDYLKQRFASEINVVRHIMNKKERYVPGDYSIQNYINLASKRLNELINLVGRDKIIHYMNSIIIVENGNDI